MEGQTIVGSAINRMERDSLGEVEVPDVERNALSFLDLERSGVLGTQPWLLSMLSLMIAAPVNDAISRCFLFYIRTVMRSFPGLSLRGAARFLLQEFGRLSQRHVARHGLEI